VVEEHGHRSILGMFPRAGEEFPGAGIDDPIDRAKIIRRIMRPVSEKIEAAAIAPHRSFSGTAAACRPGPWHAQPFEHPEKFRAPGRFLGREMVRRGNLPTGAGGQKACE
jgi:hypothetical protein